MTYRVEPTDKALVDAGEVYFRINEQSEGAALRWYEGLLKAFRSLEKNPLRCPLAPECAFFEEEIRQLIYGKYRILFTVEGETVFVLRVRHSAQEYLNPEENEGIDE
ncbi:MAG TPA: type II toxin-antitoxin system RelE/ParE family toxin [Pyrinomonadaceae bacterium]|nr:type II toxin-antitoxin system RelE/ParE family toxin [Pyrinomonadaceae bacterium]